MSHPTARRPVHRVVPAVAALLLGTLVLPQQRDAAPVPAARAADAALLDCAIRTAPGRPVTMTPAVTADARTIGVRATMRLTDCRASTRAGRHVRTGTAHIDGRVRADCSSVTPLGGKATVTWRDASGHRVGTSTIRAVRRTLHTSNVSDGLLNGKVTSGLMSGAKVRGSITPTSRISRCTESGLRSLSGAGRIALYR
ncbi:hypothetical protein H0H10_26345 [Streptomyces sp. TRM S81-3]|uniref:Uncharacterized protein n=1 Tax=Streptomyces griseicoloratus TaxID=2752516 RepID=A0A926L743_9ACTN|nr:hypothetical protein [Streptomyces griseicoloratus]MBD0422639.1 hypothetical protein [Streptomyces griseicoloratus]